MSRGQELKWSRGGSTRAWPKISPLVPAKPDSLQEGAMPAGVMPPLMWGHPEGATLHVGLKTPPAPFLGTSHDHPPCLLSVPPESSARDCCPCLMPITPLGPRIGQTSQTGNCLSHMDE